MKAVKHFCTITKHKILVMKECFRVGLYRLHHKGRNKHHYEYWLDYSLDGSGTLTGMKMPVKYVVEMFLDRIAASKVYKGEKYKDSDPLEYYKKGKADGLMHPETRRLLEKLLCMLAEEGEETTYRYIKKEILRKRN